MKVEIAFTSSPNDNTHVGSSIINLSGILTLFNLREIKTCWALEPSCGQMKPLDNQTLVDH